MVHPLISLTRAAHAHALLLELEIGEQIPELFSLHTELFDLCDVRLLVLD